LAQPLLLFCRATITNQALVDREGSSYYLSLTPRVSLPPSPQSAVQGPGFHVDSTDGVAAIYLQKAKHAKRIYAICPCIKTNSDG